MIRPNIRLAPNKFQEMVRFTGIVYDGSIRDNGTPFYLRMAMVEIAGRDVEWWSEGAEITEGSIVKAGCEQFIHVDDGRDDLSVEGIPHPWAYWIVDSHLGPEIRIKKAKHADVVFCAQLPFVKVLADHGIKATWLPLACSPNHHPTVSELKARERGYDDDVVIATTPPQFDLAFVGHLQDPATSDRVDFLDHLFRSFPNSEFAVNVYHEEMARVYHRAKIGVNHAVRDDLNMRFFELASMGVPQLADTGMVGLAQLGFESCKHFIGYDKIQAATEGTAVGFWLSDDMVLARNQLATNAFQLAREHHTYVNRLATIVTALESLD